MTPATKKLSLQEFSNLHSSSTSPLSKFSNEALCEIYKNILNPAEADIFELAESCEELSDKKLIREYGSSSREYRNTKEYIKNIVDFLRSERCRVQSFTKLLNGKPTRHWLVMQPWVK